MKPLDAFLTEMVPRLVAAERALCAGDPGPWSQIWTDTEPVTLFGADGRVRRGQAQVHPFFPRLAARFSAVDDLALDVVAAGVDGDLAYTVALERKTVVIDGAPATYTLRVTHVYRREDGQWQIVHRHGDHTQA